VELYEKILNLKEGPLQNYKPLINLSMKYLLLIIGFLCFLNKSRAQSDAEDNVAFLRVQTQITNGNYGQALLILSDVSASGKRHPLFESFSAKCYEGLSLFDSAYTFYVKLYNDTKSMDALKKAAEMKDRKQALMNCPLCHGTGHYQSIRTCSVCKGRGSVTADCSACNGSGSCTNCDGTGQTTFYMVGSTEPHYMTCTWCKGSGKCGACGGSGQKTSNCNACNGRGQFTVTIYCHH
jgi:RecJ-like exonuclease